MLTMKGVLLSWLGLIEHIERSKGGDHWIVQPDQPDRPDQLGGGAIMQPEKVLFTGS